MRILLVNMYYYPHMIGGAEHSVKLLAEGLARAGHSVAVLTLDGQKRGLSEEDVNNVHIYRGYSKSIYRRRLQGNKMHPMDMIANGLHSVVNVRMNRCVKESIRKFRPDAVHTNNLVSMSCWIWKYCYTKHIPFVHTLRDYWLLDPTTRIGGSNRLIETVFSTMMRRKTNKLVRTVTAPSFATLSVFERKQYFQNAQKVCVVNCIEFSYEKLRYWTRVKTGITDDNIVFLYAGYLSESKGVRFLLEGLKRAQSSFQIVFCGDGPLLSEVKDYGAVDSRVVIKGKLSKQELEREYERADVLIVPSMWEEPFGRVVIEAAQYAVPTIGSDRGGIPETIKALDYGEIISVDDPDSLARCIEEYSSRAVVRGKIRTLPKNLEKYTVEKQVDEFLEIYKSITESA